LVHPGALPVLDRKIAMSNQSTYASHSGHGKKPDCIDASPMPASSYSAQNCLHPENGYQIETKKIRKTNLTNLQLR
jgi:hypothetical protein